jgi:hypothetical protein
VGAPRRHDAEGTRVDAALYRRVRDEELAGLTAERAGASHRLDDAAALLDRLVLGAGFEEFLTLGAYGLLDDDAASAPAGGAVPMGSPDPDKPQGDSLRPQVA